jgi:ABC-type transport system involved in multi-copper enzyme maturation permease subunit
MHLGILRGDEDFAAMSLSGVEMMGLSLGMNLFPVVLAVFVSLFVSVEFQSGAMKNYISKGVNRLRMYLSKLTVCGLASLAMFAVYILSACITGTVLWGFDPHTIATISNVLTLILGEGLLMLAFTSVFVVFSMFLRGNGSAIATNISILILVPYLLAILDFLSGESITLSNYWINEHVGALATLTPAGGAVLQGIIVALCYLAGGTIVGSALFKEKDIK